MGCKGAQNVRTDVRGVNQGQRPADKGSSLKSNPMTQHSQRRSKPRKSSVPKWQREDPNFEREQSRYVEPIASRELLLKTLSEAPEALDAARLAQRLGMNSKTQREALGKRLAAMVRDGQIDQNERGFSAARHEELISGRVRGRAGGDASVLPDDGSAPLVLARADLATLMHRDRVQVRAVGTNERGRRVARLIKRLGAGPTRIAGLLRLRHGHCRVEPEDPGHWYEVEVAARDRHSAPDGAPVVVEITRRPQGEKPAQGRVVEVLTDQRPSDLAARFAILRHDLPGEFPPEVLHAAERFGTEVRAADRHHREDLTALPLVTIDGEDARDFDDAVYGEPLRGGGWRLVVAIADVSHYVRYGSILDLEARNRATSVYFPDRVIPMLPERLSNHLCSLMPQVERLAFVCDMRVSKAGKLSRTRFYEAVIRSHARLTYESAWDYLSNPTRHAQTLAADVRGSLDALYQIYKALKAARDARGALDFRGAEVKARIGADGVIVGFHAPLRNDAHRLIEECMIAANVETAAALRKAKAGGLFRVHGLPEDKRVVELEKMLAALNVGTQFSDEPTPREYRQLIDRLAARPDGLLLEGLVIRSLAQAVYQATNIGHFGLALEEYAHFTSPIRRYPDLIVHRALKAALLPNSAAGHRYDAEELQALGAETSQRERRADDAARDVMAYLKCLYLQSRIGEQFDASITSAQEFGLFVQLAQMPIDGLVHISTIAGDFWELDRGGLGLVGRRTRRRFSMGDRVRVRLTDVDIAQRRIDFELIDDGAARSSGRRPPERRASERAASERHSSGRRSRRRG